MLVALQIARPNRPSGIVTETAIARGDLSGKAWFIALTPAAQKKYLDRHPDRRPDNRKGASHTAYANWHKKKRQQHMEAHVREKHKARAALSLKDYPGHATAKVKSVLHQRIAEQHGEEYSKHFLNSALR